MGKWIICLAILMPVIVCVSSRRFTCHAQEVDDEEMQRAMLDKTKKAIMSYEIVEKKSEEILDEIQDSAFGDYAEKMAVVIPFMTGKISFKVKKFNFSYSHFSEKLNLDYRLGKRWKLFMKRKGSSSGMDERTGIKYSFRF